MANAPIGDDETGRSALAKASWRILPLIGLAYGVAYMDRVNISFAALRMNQDLHFSASVYGLGAGLFFLSYAAFEVPSNLLLMRFGARRWLARIMLTWGLLAVGMMFVRTPIQFYAMRFLLGLAEAGFFPGAVFYLMGWFPAEHRGRAISRFYIAFPLSTVVMGALAGALLGLHGRLGLSGWQWLFIVEGLPAVILSAAFLVGLPDSPATASWLTPDEKGWIAARLAADAQAVASGPEPSFLSALTDRRVLMLGIASMGILGGGYAFSLSAPVILEAATHLGATKIGLIVATGGVLGALAMLANGWRSDKARERHWHTAIPLVVMAGAYLVVGATTSPVVLVLAYLVTAVGASAVQGAFWGIPSDALHGRSAAVGVAMIGSIGMLGSFIGPWAFGLARDHTGGYRVGLMSLSLPFLAAAALVLVARRAAPGTVAGEPAPEAATS